MEQIINKVNTIKKLPNYDVDIVYLLKDYNETCGIFFQNDKVMFAESTENNQKFLKVETSSLTLVTMINITSLYKNQKFQNGYYNVIIFNSDIDDEYFDVFIRLCFLYSTNTGSDLYSFFNSLVALFQLPNDDMTRNSIGLYGELIFIREVYEKLSIDLSNSWQIDGIYSKYDFKHKNVNFEIKSTILEKNSFYIKHSQVFNSDKNFLVLIKLNKGETKLRDLINYFIYSTPFSKNFDFQLRLHNSFIKLPRVQLEKTYGNPYFYIYKCSELKTILDIPDEINNVTYEYTFNLSSAKTIIDLKKFLN